MMQVMNDMSRTDSAFSDFQSIFQAYDQTVQAAPDNTSISTDTEYTNNNPTIQGNRTDEKIHHLSTHENTENTDTTDQSSSQHSDNSMDHIMQLLQEYDTNTRSAILTGHYRLSIHITGIKINPIKQKRRSIAMNQFENDPRLKNLMPLKRQIILQPCNGSHNATMEQMPP